MPEQQNEVLIAKLNEVIDVLGALSTGTLRQMVKPGTRFVAATGCESACDCRGSMCGCNGVVSANERFAVMSFPDFVEQRKARVRELQEELSHLEVKRELLE